MAIGARASDIRLQFLIEALILSLAGGIIGIITGVVGAKLIYPGTDLIQHAGIANVRRGPVHKLQKMHDNKTHYFGYNREYTILLEPLEHVFLSAERNIWTSEDSLKI